MSALEQEIYEKFQQLDDEAKRRVLHMLAEQQANPAAQGDWLDEARALRAEMRTKYGKLAFSAAMLVNEDREERLNDLMDRY